MSAIYFHTETKTVAVRGSERALFGNICSALVWDVLGPYWKDVKILFPPDHYVHGDGTQGNEQNVEIAVHVSGMSGPLSLDGQPINMFFVELNTALTMGSDYVKLAARLHGQCEVHAWVAGKNRAWLARIVEQGVNSGFYRSDAGWVEVVNFLNENDVDPVVTSYSVCDQFPNADIAHVIDSAWSRMSHHKQWDRAFDELVKSKGGLELKPGVAWRCTSFGDGENASTLLAKLIAKRKEVEQ